MKKLFSILFLVVIFSSLFLFRVPLIQRFSPSVAEYYGFDIRNLEISQIDADKIVIPVLSMRHADDSMRAQIEIYDLVIEIVGYKAEVSNVSSGHVFIDVEAMDSVGMAPSEQSVKDFIKSLPIFAVDVDHVEIKYHLGEEDLLRFEGVLSYANQATLKGVLSGKNKFDATVDLSIDESNFSLNILQASNAKATIDLNGDYQILDDWLAVKLSGDVSIAAINQFLLSFGVEEYVQEDASYIKAKFELDLNRSTQDIIQSFAAHVDFDSALHISSKQFGLRQAQVDVSASCRVEKLEITGCLFKNPQRAVVDFYQPPEWLNKYFDDVGNKYVVEVNPSDQLMAQISFKEILRANIKGDAYIDVRTQSSRLKISAWVSGLSFNGVDQDWQLDAGYKFKLEGLNINAPVKISRFLMNGQGKLKADTQRINMLLNEGFVANALNVNYDGYQTKKVQLKQLHDARIVYRYKENHVETENVRFSLSSNRMRNGDIEIESAPIQLHVLSLVYSDAGQKLMARIDADNFLLNALGIGMSAYELAAEINLNNNELSIDGDIGLGKQKHSLNLSAEHNVQTGLGLGNMQANAIALANNEIISNQIGESGFPLQLKGGELDVDIGAVWDVNKASSEINVKLNVERAIGDYAQNQFSDFNVALEFVGQDGWKLKQAANVEIGSVNVGVPLNDVSMRLDRMEYQVQEQPLIKLSDLSASALDGSIYAKQVEIDLSRRQNNFSIYLSSLSLEKLIALNQTDDLVASGSFDGELPMQLHDGVFLINDGWLCADERGGHIKYGRIGEILAGNEDLQLVGELLEDFQYNEMSAQVNLVSGGGLTLATKLHGRSPQATLNKQVNLNFNIDFNLWKFLESARLLTRIDQDVSEQILSNQKK